MDRPGVEKLHIDDVLGAIRLLGGGPFNAGIGAAKRLREGVDQSAFIVATDSVGLLFFDAEGTRRQGPHEALHDGVDPASEVGR